MQPKKRYFFITPYTLFFIITSGFFQQLAAKPKTTPKITVILVIDQFSYDYTLKLRSYFKYGLKELFDHGLFYENAFYTHAVTETTTGHLNLITGVYPKDNGGITNQWITPDGIKVHYEFDTAPNAIPFGWTVQDGGKSTKNTLVDTLTDQFVLNTPHAQAWALSLKSYPAITTAGKLGKAVWFDEKSGVFTSTPQYFTTLPAWITHYNEKIRTQHNTITWKTRYPRTSKAYQFPFVDNYEFAAIKGGYIAHSPIKINAHDKKPYEVFMRTPRASQSLFELAKLCVDHNLNLQTSSKMFLVLSLSNLDLIGHLCGPDSREIIDTIYHLDYQIQTFLTYLERKVGLKNVLVVLTADHGICPIPEIQQKKGFKNARRIYAPKLIEAMNAEIKKVFGVHNIIQAYEPTSFRLNYKIFKVLTSAVQTKILKHLKAFLKKQPGIKNAWTFDELKNTFYEKDRIETYYQKQLFEGRTGDLICFPDYYCQVTNYPTGTSHDTPHAYNLHVPLVIYHKGVITPKKIPTKVLMAQVPVTLAHLLHIQKPSATPFESLPEIEIYARS